MAGYCLAESDNANKCFSLILNPLPGGKTKTFDAFVDLLMKAIHESDFIDALNWYLVMEVLAISQKFDAAIAEITNEAELKAAIYDLDWYKRHQIDPIWVREQLSANRFLSQIAPESHSGRTQQARIVVRYELVSSKECLAYYMTELSEAKIASTSYSMISHFFS
ncbi:MAG: hypothetical protein U0996_03275 [Planctomycetaceae bacterium]